MRQGAGVAAVELGAHLLGEAFALHNPGVAHLNGGASQPLHHAGDQCLGQIFHALHAMAHGGSGQLFAQHGNGVEFVAGN